MSTPLAATPTNGGSVTPGNPPLQVVLWAPDGQGGYEEMDLGGGAGTVQSVAGVAPDEETGNVALTHADLGPVELADLGFDPETQAEWDAASTTINAELATKATKADTYGKAAVDGLLAAKRDIADSYSKAQVDALRARATLAKATASLAAGASETGVIALGKSFRAMRVVTDRPARVRLYATAAQRTADASRAFGTAPTGNHGVLLDVLTATGALTQVLAPQVNGSNLEATPTPDIPYSITNADSAAAVVTATFTYTTTEA